MSFVFVVTLGSRTGRYLAVNLKCAVGVCLTYLTASRMDELLLSLLKH